MKETILTGIRSNEEPTIAHLLSVMPAMADLQKKFSDNYRINVFVPDLHSFTTPIDHSVLFKNTIQGLKYYVAAGLDLDDKNTFIYRQSFIPAHSELTWILDCFTYVGEMQRMTQFKDKSEGAKSVSMGLMNYPVLMAADILLYNAKYVPVGEDQFQHLEITRDIAMRFNNKFGDIFTVPVDTAEQMKFIGRKEGLRIRDLVNPEKKMSKSAEDKTKISVNDSPTDAHKKIMSATTDSIGEINFDWKSQPGVTSLLAILAILAGKSQEEINAKWVGKNSYGDLKKAVADAVCDFLADFQEKVSQVSDEEIIAKLEHDEQEVAKTANETLLRAQKAVGLRV